MPPVMGGSVLLWPEDELGRSMARGAAGGLNDGWRAGVSKLNLGLLGDCSSVRERLTGCDDGEVTDLTFTGDAWLAVFAFSGVLWAGAGSGWVTGLLRRRAERLSRSSTVDSMLSMGV